MSICVAVSGWPARPLASGDHRVRGAHSVRWIASDNVPCSSLSSQITLASVSHRYWPPDRILIRYCIEYPHYPYTCIMNFYLDKELQSRLIEQSLCMLLMSLIKTLN